MPEQPIPSTAEASAPSTTAPVSPIQYMKGIGPRRAEALALAGVLTPSDLLRFYPRSYIDRNSVPSLRDLRTALLNAQQQDAFSEQNMNLQTEITVVAFVRAVRDRTFGKNRTMVIVELDDHSGVKAEIVFWHQAEYFKRIFETDQLLAVSGLAEYAYGKIQFNHPEIERIDPDDAESYSNGRILPKYRLTQKMKDAGLTMRVMRNLITSVIDQEIPNLRETLSDELLTKFDFPHIQAAARQLHFPDSHEALAKARERMKFEELFFFEMLLAMRHNGIKSLDKAPAIAEKSPLARTMLELLSFELTRAQKKVLREIVEDMRTTKPMNRLLQGDVGSGKTVVALLGMLAAIDAGLQCVLMAPTEILAEQHYNTFRDYAEKLNAKLAELGDPRTITVAQLVGGQKKRQRNTINEQIASGEVNIVVGTHAVFQSAVEYKRLGLVVIDEQHRFGVLQRAELKKKATASFAGENSFAIPELEKNTLVAQIPSVAQTFLSVPIHQAPNLKRTRRNLPHWTLDGASYFVTFSARSALNTAEQNVVFQHILQGHTRFYDLQALVVMPDHVHLILRPQERELSEIMKGMKGASAHLINQQRGTVGEYIWQEESFDRIIRDEREWDETIRYIYKNPLKAGLVKEDEPYSFLWAIGYDNDFASPMQNVSQTRMSVLREEKSVPQEEKKTKEKQATQTEPHEISPHIMVMSATPIPRTLSMTVYGDLDVSIIDELPKNRKPIKTKVVFESKLPVVFQFIREQIEKGHQAYIVYPLVEKSEKVEAKSAVEHFERLQHEVFPDLKMGLLHGQMLWYEKEDAMKAFKNKEFHILVATTVVEVGIDIPNATVMLIENADRFGLAQLHQLRGRVGRGAEQSFCLLATKDHFKFHLGKKENEAQERKSCIIRLKTMQDTSDGFKIAEVDLKLRGPGDFLGTRQSGIPEFTFADLVSDGDVITLARREAFAIVAEDPHLRKAENATIRTEFLRQHQKDFTLLDVA